MNLKFWTKKEEVIVRIPPSPTGNLHIGTARTALFNYLFAKQNNGKIVLRMEDTDKERSKDEFEKNIIEGLNWLGIEWDEFYRQSERNEIYRNFLNKLIKQKKAYISKEKEGERSEVIRFKNPNKRVKFIDLIRGEIEFDTTELGDFVIAKSLDEPLYHLAVVVDDHKSKVTHVIRGEDGISNTPRQILIQEAIGAKRPIYAHLPLILNEKKAKLSKRDGVTSLDEYKNKGYLKEAIINFLALLGWAPKDNREMFSIDELIENFSIKDVQKGGAVFNINKLDWFNKEYIKKLSDKEILSKINVDKLDERTLKRALPEIKERLTHIDDLNKLFEPKNEFGYIFEINKFEIKKLNWKNNDFPVTKSYLQEIVDRLEKLDDNDFESDKIKESIWDFADQNGKGDVLWPFRYALSGKDKSIDPFTLSFILGKKETIKRLQNAINNIQT